MEDKRSNFPLLAELKDIILEDWDKVDKRTSLSSKTMRLYPFKGEDMKHLEATPLVDAGIMRLAKLVTPRRCHILQGWP